MPGPLTSLPTTTTLSSGNLFYVEASGASKAISLANIIVELDGEYLRLDATNDPITAPLEVEGGLTLTRNVGRLRFRSSPLGTNYWDLFANISDSVDGGLSVRDDSDNNLLEVTNSEIVVNEEGMDRDFRIEAVGETNALRVQGNSGNVGVGESDPNARLLVNGSFGGKVITVTTTAHNAGDEMVILCDDDSAGGKITITLPLASESADRFYLIKRLGTTEDTVITPSGSDEIDGFTFVELTRQNMAGLLVCDGSNWSVLASHDPDIIEPLIAYNEPPSTTSQSLTGTYSPLDFTVPNMIDPADAWSITNGVLSYLGNASESESISFTFSMTRSGGGSGDTQLDFRLGRAIGADPGASDAVGPEFSQAIGRDGDTIISLRFVVQTAPGARFALLAKQDASHTWVVAGTLIIVDE